MCILGANFSVMFSRGRYVMHDAIPSSLDVGQPHYTSKMNFLLNVEVMCGTLRSGWSRSYLELLQLEINFRRTF
jgi:hypothetical protein